jgi:hypothetical protein
MEEIPERTETEDYRCCCVYIDSDDEENSCRVPVQPDQPFCKACEDRHVTSSVVLAGLVTVSARLNRKEQV